MAGNFLIPFKYFSNIKAAIIFLIAAFFALDSTVTDLISNT